MFEGGIWLAGKEYEARPAVRFSKDGLRWSESIPVPEIEANGDTYFNPGGTTGVIIK